MKTAKEMLAAIDRFLSTADLRERRRLWDVLTALRGPDSGDDPLKDRTTARIRSQALPLTHNTTAYSIAIFRPGEAVTVNPPETHFEEHIYMAHKTLLAMGLKPIKEVVEEVLWEVP